MSKKYQAHIFEQTQRESWAQKSPDNHYQSSCRQRWAAWWLSGEWKAGWRTRWVREKPQPRCCPSHSGTETKATWMWPDVKASSAGSQQKGRRIKTGTDLVYAGFDSHHYGVTKHFSVFRQSFPGLKSGLILKVHPVTRRCHLLGNHQYISSTAKQIYPSPPRWSHCLQVSKNFSWLLPGNLE